jgi:deoxyribodipyrimidine photo-lyase
MNIKPFAIHWFRRDLRCLQNQSLKDLAKEFDGRVIGIFCFDHKFLVRKDFSANRFQFFMHTLVALRDELRGQGSDLLFMDIGPQAAFEKLFKGAHRKLKTIPAKIQFSRDYEPFAVQRDQSVIKQLISYQIQVQSYRDHLVFEPHEIHKPSSDDGYQIYTPFSRKWLDQYSELGSKRSVPISAIENYYRKHQLDFKRCAMTWNDLGDFQNESDALLAHYIEANQRKVTVNIPPAGTKAALKNILEFSPKIKAYSDQRDFMAMQGTSKIAAYLKNGSITVAQLIASHKLKSYKKPQTSPERYFSQLIWREFYYHILYRHPNCEKEAFLSKFRKIKWPNNPEWFEAWKEGRTGYPVVDAAMRQLSATGLMHNRSRMIVASFLTKDLLIDWRWGEAYFMEQLLDGDLAPNNGGWQWAASTGCDPQPYFRIFNPHLQSKRFDPDGAYIKEFVPELRHLNKKQIHAPTPEQRGDYCDEIVDHNIQRMRALELYKTENP